MVLRFGSLWLVDVWVTLCLFSQALLDYMSQVLCCRRCFHSQCFSIDFTLFWLSATEELLIQMVLSIILPQVLFFHAKQVRLSIYRTSVETYVSRVSPQVLNAVFVDGHGNRILKHPKRQVELPGIVQICAYILSSL